MAKNGCQKKPIFFRNFRNKSCSILMLHKIYKNKKVAPKLIFFNEIFLGFLTLKINFENQILTLFDVYFWPFNMFHEKINTIFCDQCNHSFNLNCFYQIPLTWWKTYPGRQNPLLNGALTVFPLKSLGLPVKEFGASVNPNTGDLVISSAKGEIHSGFYQCFATNKAGQIVSKSFAQVGDSILSNSDDYDAFDEVESVRDFQVSPIYIFFLTHDIYKKFNHRLPSQNGICVKFLTV